MKTINIFMLEALDACDEQRARFRELYGEADVPLTLENALNAYERGVNVLWLQRFLTDEEKTIFSTAECLAWIEYLKNDQKNYQLVDDFYLEYKKTCIRVLIPMLLTD